ncbi:glycosyltransferase family 2 protein [Rossellomorea vietnamensis]|uniref:glycosyltransferase family 2 protein n=1 Tax=Rossellomorea vietnamensis TaxID=218284 RepID=UPI00077C994F|nr:glycosyltransferase family 2 protein [Rossellomorea vietnamensis]
MKLSEGICDVGVKHPFENELVSVITPVYNSGKYITKTLDSVLNQTYEQIEIILVDDCSTDNSQELIRDYLSKHENIRYHRLEENSGAAVARNKAIDLAKGRFVAFLDSDDLWYPKKIEKQLELMEQKNAAICYTAIEMIDENDNLIKDKRNVIEMVNYKFLLKNTMIATSTVVVDRNLTGAFKMPLIRSGQDYATWLLLMRNGTNAYGINEVFVKYRKSNNSLSSNKVKNIKKVWKIQTKNEGINPVSASYYSICYALNAFKKHYL